MGPNHAEDLDADAHAERLTAKEQAKQDVLTVLKIAGSLYCAERRFSEGAALAIAGTRQYSAVTQPLFIE